MNVFRHEAMPYNNNNNNNNLKGISRYPLPVLSLVYMSQYSIRITSCSMDYGDPTIDEHPVAVDAHCSSVVSVRPLVNVMQRPHQQ